MFSSSILDVAIGLVFVFLLLSLISSAASELIERFSKKRATFLERGIKELVGDIGSEESEAFVKAIYSHGLVNALYKGDYASASQNGELPSYIPARNFALAVLDLTKSAKELPPNVLKALGAFVELADDKVDALRQEVENWYNSAMDRVSGWYKRRSQKIVLTLGILLTILINADCIQIARRLSTDATLRQAAERLAENTAKQNPNGSAPATTPPADAKTDGTEGGSVAGALNDMKDNLAKLDGVGLPLGWERPKSLQDFGMQVVTHLPGWIITALAISLGAPFWFDVLNKIIVVRSTVKPSEKSGTEASKDATRHQAPVVVNLPATAHPAQPPAPNPAPRQDSGAGPAQGPGNGQAT
jgi:hypothetical protein